MSSAECKIWHGPKGLPTLTQLIATSCGATQAALVMFIKTTNSSDDPKLPAAVEANASWAVTRMQPIPAAGSTHRDRGDEGRGVSLAVILFLCGPPPRELAGPGRAASLAAQSQVHRAAIPVRSAAGSTAGTEALGPRPVGDRVLGADVFAVTRCRGLRRPRRTGLRLARARLRSRSAVRRCPAGRVDLEQGSRHSPVLAACWMPRPQPTRAQLHHAVNDISTRGCWRHIAGSLPLALGFFHASFAHLQRPVPHR
jgi:hypothetical protein